MCGAQEVTENRAVYRKVVGEAVFWTMVFARDCGACGRASLPACELGWFQMAVARHLARVRACSAEELALMRTALGLSRAELARELGTTELAASQWEEALSLPPPETLAALHALVLQRTGDTPLMPIGVRARLPGE
jgi:DNA-binding transcriptional regulator YiaG